MKRILIALLFLVILGGEAKAVTCTYNASNIVSVAQSSNSTPLVTSASTDHSGSYPAWKAFDHVCNAAWASLWSCNEPFSTPQWLEVDLGSGNSAAIGSYSITVQSYLYSLQEWKVQGSNDNSAWTDVDYQTGITSWSGEEMKTYTLGSTSAAYRYWRLYIITNQYLTYSPAIEEFQLLAPAGGGGLTDTLDGKIIVTIDSKLPVNWNGVTLD